MDIKESGEMYLETIYVLSFKQDKVRAIDVAEYMQYSKPSVSRGLHILEEKGYLTIESNGNLKLSQQGILQAKSIYEKHQIFTKALIMLGVDPDVAEQDACRIEHVISEQTFIKLKQHLSKF